MAGWDCSTRNGCLFDAITDWTYSRELSCFIRRLKLGCQLYLLLKDEIEHGLGQNLHQILVDSWLVPGLP